MTWFKVDDGFWSNPKVVALSDGAVALWVRAGSYACQHLTDGVVPVGAIRMLGERVAVDELIAAGLWDQVDDGYQFHDWAMYQPSRDSVLADRAANAARQAVARNPELREAIRQRDGGRCRYCGQLVEWKNRRGPVGGTYDHVIPNGGTEFDNLVVCCRGCNSRKGRRTPEQAGMTLIQLGDKKTSKTSQVGSKSDLDRQVENDLDRVAAVRVPRPDPTRPDQKEEGGCVSREVTTRTRETSPLPGRCRQHEHELTPPPCGACADARRAAEAAERDHAAHAAERRAAEREQIAAARRAEIDACGLCDETGYRAGRVCDHDPDADERNRRGIGLIRETLTKTGTPK